MYALCASGAVNMQVFVRKFLCSILKTTTKKTNKKPQQYYIIIICFIYISVNFYSVIYLSTYLSVCPSLCLCPILCVCLSLPSHPHSPSPLCAVSLQAVTILCVHTYSGDRSLASFRVCQRCTLSVRTGPRGRSGNGVSIFHALSLTGSGGLPPPSPTPHPQFPPVQCLLIHFQRTHFFFFFTA